jgi:hypothetical protein
MTQYDMTKASELLESAYLALDQGQDRSVIIMYDYGDKIHSFVRNTNVQDTVNAVFILLRSIYDTVGAEMFIGVMNVMARDILRVEEERPTVH